MLDEQDVLACMLGGPGRIDGATGADHVIGACCPGADHTAARALARAESIASNDREACASASIVRDPSDPTPPDRTRPARPAAA